MTQPPEGFGDRSGPTDRLRQHAQHARREALFANWRLRRRLRENRQNNPKPPYGALAAVVSSVTAGGYAVVDGFMDTHAIPFISIPNGQQPIEIAAGLLIAAAGLTYGSVVASRRMRVM